MLDFVFLKHLLATMPIMAAAKLSHRQCTVYLLSTSGILANDKATRNVQPMLDGTGG